MGEKRGWYYSFTLQFILILLLVSIAFLSILKWNKPFWTFGYDIFISLLYLKFLLKASPWEKAGLWARRVIRISFSVILWSIIQWSLNFFFGFEKFPPEKYIFSFSLLLSIYFFSNRYLREIFKEGGILWS